MCYHPKTNKTNRDETNVLPLPNKIEHKCDNRRETKELQMMRKDVKLFHDYSPITYAGPLQLLKSNQGVFKEVIMRRNKDNCATCSNPAIDAIPRAGSNAHEAIAKRIVKSSDRTAKSHLTQFPHRFEKVSEDTITPSVGKGNEKAEIMSSGAVKINKANMPVERSIKQEITTNNKFPSADFICHGGKAGAIFQSRKSEFATKLIAETSIIYDEVVRVTGHFVNQRKVQLLNIDKI